MGSKEKEEEVQTTLYDRYVEAQAPVNIAVIKYWGKNDEQLKTPLNDSLSATISIDDMCTTTSIKLSVYNLNDRLILNGKEEELTEDSPVTQMLKFVRSSQAKNLCKEVLELKAYIVSNNDFPTAAGLASSASGYACLAYTIGQLYGIADPTELSKIARRGSGSACRSIFGGFVQWKRGNDHDSSYALQVADHLHWQEMRVLICVVNDSKKGVSSSLGMSRSVKTSSLIHYRAENVVPGRIETIKKAILEKDFETFAKVTMEDSNQFHAICLDTTPPIFYLNETSHAIIKLCHAVNDFYGAAKVAYTFDAGPNACIYLLESFVPTFIAIINQYFPVHDPLRPNLRIEIQGRMACTCPCDIKPVTEHLVRAGLYKLPNSIKYLINTVIGQGPKLTVLSDNKKISDLGVRYDFTVKI